MPVGPLAVLTCENVIRSSGNMQDEEAKNTPCMKDSYKISLHSINFITHEPTDNNSIRGVCRRPIIIRFQNQSEILVTTHLIIVR